MHFRTALDGGGLRQLRRGQPLLHGRAADGDLRGRPLQVRGRARLHEQAALRPQARPRHAPAALRPGVPHRQVLRRPRARSRATGASTTRSPPDTITANQMQVRTIGLRECLERVIAKSGYDVQAWTAGRRPGHRHRRLVVHQRRRPAHLLERHAALGRADQGRPRRGSDGLLRLDGHRPGLRLGARLRGGGGAGHRAQGHPRRHRRHRSHARRSRLVFVAGHPHDRQRGHRGRAQAARARPGRGGAEARGAGRAAEGRGRAHLGHGRPCACAALRGGGRAGGGGARHAGRGRAPTRRRARVAKWKGAGVGPTPDLLVFGGGGRGVGGPRRPASSAWTRSGSPTTSAAPSTRCS